MLLASLAGPLSAQTVGLKGYLIEGWQSERGLPQDKVTGIAQTRDGYLWISTLDGLARFDGLRFRLFKAGDTPALGSGRVRFLFTGRQGEIWLATQEGGLVQFKDGRFQPLLVPEQQGTHPAVVQVAEDESGGLWLSTEDGKVGRLANGLYSLVSTNWDPTGKTTFQVRADLRGRLLAVSDSGVNRVVNERLVPVLQGSRGEYVVHCPSRGGGWWLSAGGQVRLWRDGQWIITIPGPSPSAAVPRGGLEDRAGNLWLPTWGTGLFRCGTNGAPLQFTKQDGLGSDFVRALCEDSEGNLWVGTEGGGLSRLHRPLFTVYGLAQDLSWEWITSVSAGPDGELWVGTDGYGLNRLRGDLIRPASNAPDLAPLHAMTALADRQGRVWVGTRQGGVYQWKDGNPTRVAGFPATSTWVRSLYEDSRGAIWVGRFNTDALLRIQNGAVSNLALPEIRRAGGCAGDGRGRGGRFVDRHGRQRTVSLAEGAVHPLHARERAGQRPGLGASARGRRLVVDRHLRRRLDPAQGRTDDNLHDAPRPGGRRDLSHRGRRAGTILAEFPPGGVPGEQE